MLRRQSQRRLPIYLLSASPVFDFVLPSLHHRFLWSVSGSHGAAGEAGPNYPQAQEAAEGLLQEDRRDGR